MNPPLRAPLGAALALVIALAALTGPPAPGVVAAVTVALVAMVAVGWPQLLELPSGAGTRIVVGATGIGSVAMAWQAPGSLSPMEGIAAVCAAGVFGTFVHQMTRRDRSDLTASLTGTAAGAMLTGLAGCWVHAQRLASSSGDLPIVVCAGAAALTAALLVMAPPLSRALLVPLAILAAAAVGAIVLMALPTSVHPLIGLALGGGVGLGAAAAQTLLGSLLLAREPLPSLTVAAAPVTTAGVVVLLVVRLLAGPPA